MVAKVSQNNQGYHHKTWQLGRALLNERDERNHTEYPKQKDEGDTLGRGKDLRHLSLTLAAVKILKPW